MNCYEVVRHYKGKSADYDIVVTGHICLTKDEAMELAEELNYRTKRDNLDYTYIHTISPYICITSANVIFFPLYNCIM